MKQKSCACVPLNNSNLDQNSLAAHGMSSAALQMRTAT
jgi:hypothetical protein